MKGRVREEATERQNCLSSHQQSKEGSRPALSLTWPPTSHFQHPLPSPSIPAPHAKANPPGVSPPSPLSPSPNRPILSQTLPQLPLHLNFVTAVSCAHSTSASHFMITSGVQCTEGHAVFVVPTRLTYGQLNSCRLATGNLHSKEHV